MPAVKRLVCLANSRKLQGRCIAGKEWTDTGAGAWIRPVSATETGELSLFDYRYQTGGEPRLLDIIDIHLRRRQPKSYQPENWLIDPEIPWLSRDRVRWESLSALADHPATLWNTGDSTTTGCNDRVCISEATKQHASLYLLQLDALVLHVYTPPSRSRRQRRVQARFTYRGVHYAMWLTDPRDERRFLAKPDGAYPIGPCFVTVSLSEPLDGVCYKLLAAAITPRPLT